MKKFRTLYAFIMALTMIMAMITVVSADSTTELKEMKVYAINTAGEKTEVPVEFSQTTYTYDLTVMSDVKEIQIEATPADSTSTWVIEKDGINTKMDFGNNITVVAVKSSTGVINKYTLNTKKLTETEQASYESETNEEDESKVSTESSDVTVKVGKTKFKLSENFDESAIPEGFKKSSAKYKGEKYACIKGEVKDLIAFYLVGDDKEGFYIYNSDSKDFYPMNNVQIKSRMYTIVQPEETDDILENYESKKVKIIDAEVDAWVMDEEEGLYLVYAMNWNGETSLYSYDDNEKCMQRYIVSADANSQVEAANQAYNNLQDKYNRLVDRYNILLKALCVAAVLIIILFFVVINLAINKKEKRILKESEEGEDSFESEDEVENESETEETEETEEIEEIEEQEQVDDSDVIVNDDDFNEPETETEEPVEAKVDSITATEEPIEAIEEPVAETEETAEQMAEEVETQQTGETLSEDSIEQASKIAQKESEEDLKETLKSMLPDDDDDFEFIDLN